MNTRENVGSEFIGVQPLSYVPIEEHQDDRVRKIYERYHAGKTIILDDLRYLWLKDPAGCKKLTKTIIEAKSKQRFIEEPDTKAELNKLIDIGAYSKSSEDIRDQQNHIEVIAGFDVPPKPQMPQENIQEMLTSMKLVLENMSYEDLIEMRKHINEALVLEKIGDKMKYWNDAFEDKIMMYTYEIEKKFNMLA